MGCFGPLFVHHDFQLWILFEKICVLLFADMSAVSVKHAISSIDKLTERAAVMHRRICDDTIHYYFALLTHLDVISIPCFVDSASCECSFLALYTINRQTFPQETG